MRTLWPASMVSLHSQAVWSASLGSQSLGSGSARSGSRLVLCSMIPLYRHKSVNPGKHCGGTVKILGEGQSGRVPLRDCYGKKIAFTASLMRNTLDGFTRIYSSRNVIPLSMSLLYLESKSHCPLCRDSFELVHFWTAFLPYPGKTC